MIDPIHKANIAFNEGRELDSNPYPKGSDDYTKYMIQMGRRQLEDFRETNHCFGESHGPK